MVTWENYEEYMLLEADGELTETEQKALYAFLEAHPELKSELALFKATKLEPDTAMVYEGKEQLLKTEPIKQKRVIDLRAWWVYGGVAAACLAAVMLLIRTNEKENEPIQTTAKTDTHNTHIATAPVAKEDFHSTPVAPVAIETKEKAQPQTIAKTKKQTINQYNIPKTEQVAINEKTEQPQLPIQEPEQPKEELIAQQEPAPIPVIEEPSQPLETTPAESGTKKALAFGRIEDRFSAIPEIKEAVNEKIEKVKHITGKIKDTDIRFRFGNNEVVVKL
jgi:hypothetical protein